MRRSAIIQSIRTAFVGVPRPDFTLADAAVADEWGDESVRFDERDQDWQDIPDELISRSTAAFCFLPLRCWRYYLPAFMIWSVEHVRDFKTETPQHLVYTLTKREEVPAFRDSLTPEQCEVVVAFLEFWRSEYPCDLRDDDFRFWISHLA
jgi:hypothetical protein